MGVSRKTVSQWIARYKFYGEAGLKNKKPGPRKGSPVWNKISVEIEEKVIEIVKREPFRDPDWIANELFLFYVSRLLSIKVLYTEYSKETRSIITMDIISTEKNQNGMP